MFIPFVYTCDGLCSTVAMYMYMYLGSCEIGVYPCTKGIHSDGV